MTTGRDIIRKLLGYGTPPSHGSCAYGIECIKDHMLRATLYMDEALRFSSEGTITPEAQAKIILARTQLLCEDDFQEALKLGPPLNLEVMKLLASCRSMWKAIESSGVDQGYGEVGQLVKLCEHMKTLRDKAYQIDRMYKESHAQEKEEEAETDDGRNEPSET